MVASARSLVLLSILLASPAIARADDPWWGRDKALHLGASAGLAAGGYAVGAALFDEKAPRLAIGAGLSLGAGIAKEAVDLGGAGDASWRDLFWDAVGTGAGLLLAFGVDVIFFEAPDAPPGERALLAGVRGTF